MGLTVFYQEDVTRILAATLEVQRNSARALAPLDAEAAAAYQRGFVDALLAVAVAFGVRAPSAARVAGGTAGGGASGTTRETRPYKGDGAAGTVGGNGWR